MLIWKHTVKNILFGKKTAAKNWTTEHTRMVIRLLKNVCSLFFFSSFFYCDVYIYVYAVSFFSRHREIETKVIL